MDKKGQQTQKKIRMSIRSKLWITLSLLAVGVLAFLWISQLILYNFSYDAMSKSAFVNICEDIVDKYEPDSESYYTSLSQSSKRNGLLITLFYAEDLDIPAGQYGTMYQIYRAHPYQTSEYDRNVVTEVDWTYYQKRTFFQNFFSEPKAGKYFVYDVSEPQTLAYGNTAYYAQDYLVFFYIEIYSFPFSISTNVLMTQLIITSIICVLFAAALAFWSSRQLSKPLTKFSETAKLLAEGNFDVKFAGYGYKEISVLADTLNYATAEIKKTDTFRKEFLANVSHDLRTPITMVKGYAEMIRDISGENKAKRDVHAQIIIDEADRLTNLVNDILLMSKLNAGTAELDIRSFDLGLLASNALSRFQIKSDRDNYTIISDISENLNVDADFTKIEQVLYNLIENAMNYTGPDKTVYVRAFETESGRKRVEISDTGKGIPPEEIPHVWDRYYRVNQHKRSVRGSGLGLNIVHGVLENHNANYGIDSTVGKGTTFWFEL